MAKTKVDVKHLARLIIGVARKDATSTEIAAILAASGHKISVNSVRSLKAHHTMTQA